MLCLLAMVLTLFSIPAQAGAFKVYPLSLSFDKRTKTSVLTLVNDGDQAVSIQIDSKQWLQDERGEDYYKDTTDIAFFPKIVKIAPGNERIIRIGFQGKRDSNQEKTYRVFAQELPDQSSKRSALSFALRFSVPLFIEPVQKTTKSSLFGASVQSGKAMLGIHNAGNTHIIVNKIHVTGLDARSKEQFFTEAKGWYVLSGAQRVFTIPVDAKDCQSATKIEFAVRTPEKTLTTQTNINRNQCSLVPESFSKAE